MVSVASQEYKINQYHILKDRILYYQDEDIAQFEKETGKNASIMGREPKKFML